MRRDFLSELQNAPTDEEREWIVLSLSLDGLPKNLQGAVWAAAVPHWFDAAFLASLLGNSLPEVRSLMIDLESLSFVESVEGLGYCVHERTRQLMLGRLWRDDRKRFVALSARAASFCARFGEDYPNIAIEKIYHLLISDLDLGISELRATAEKWFHSRVMADSTIETLLAVCEEQVDAGRSPNRVLGWTLLWGALIESRHPDLSAVNLI